MEAHDSATKPRFSHAELIRTIQDFAADMRDVESTTEAARRYLDDPGTARDLLTRIADDGGNAGWLITGLMLGIEMERSR